MRIFCRTGCIVSGYEKIIFSKKIIKGFIDKSGKRQYYETIMVSICARGWENDEKL